MESSLRRFNIDALRERLQSKPRDATPRPAIEGATAPHPLASVVGGETVGGCHVITTRYEPDYAHAGFPLFSMWESHGTTLARLSRDSRMEGFDFRRTLFLDTETNGLAGGAGTYAFLIGVAYWEGDYFYVKQYFMRNPSEERAVLAHISELLAQFESFVTFNGKSFDIPVLETRYVLARQPRALRERLHLDLLHPARRFWKWRLESCALGQLEHHILGLARSESDVPGYLIPYLYNTYLRDQNAEPLKGIFYHNHQDLMALAALAVHMTRVVGDPTRYAAPYGHDHYALGCFYEECGDFPAAEQAYRRALRSPMPLSLQRDTMRHLGGLLKRQQRWEDAAEWWRALVAMNDLTGYEELAKWHEHVRRDYAAAERAVGAALTAAASGRMAIVPEQRRQLEHRLQRVQKKLAHATAQA
jgi:uncharacterized protein YprB with RNaseH-like and TPR domain